MITPILADVVMFRKDSTATKEIVSQKAIEDGPDTIIGVESGGTQKAMASDLMKRRDLMEYQVKGVDPKGQKVGRAMPWVLKIEDG